MTYLALARRTRPQTLDTVIGHEAIIQTLKASLAQSRIHHAYLFTGIHGTGKTSLGRILAKCLSCETGITPTPCGTCSACVSITEGRYPDLIEVDAASKTKVEDTRELLEHLPFSPSQGRFKIYLIDEMHMLSKHSANALLKSLEEPPEHIKFIFATTEVDKILPTILSRCLRFHLKRLPERTLQRHLSSLLEQENIAFEPAAVDAIVRLAHGSVRDALSLLDQAIAHGSSDLTLDALLTLLGHTPLDVQIHLLEALAQHDLQTALQHLNHADEAGFDVFQLCDALLTRTHELALFQATQTPADTWAHWTTQFETLAGTFKPEDLQILYQSLLKAQDTLSLSPTPRMGLEMLLMRFLHFSAPELTLQQSLTHLPQVATSQPPSPSVFPQPAVLDETPTPASLPPTTPPRNTLTSEATAWADLIKQLSLKGPTLALAQHCVWVGKDNQHITLSLAPEHAPLRSTMAETRLKTALEAHFSDSLRLSIDLKASETDTPAITEDKKAQAAHQKAQSSLEKDPTMALLLQEFDAQIDPQTIQSQKEELQSGA